MSQYKTGEQVRHKSGGPLMIVDTIRGNGTLICKWWNGKVFECDTFAPESLLSADGEGDAPPDRIGVIGRKLG
jgi:uncharacterized protein YodC (DUF2158 family)